MSGYLPTPPSEGTVPASHATVFLPTPFHPQAEEYAARRFGRLVRAEEGGLTRKQCLEECDAVLLRIGDMSGEDIARANKLRIIARNGTGVDSIDLEECKRRGVVVTNCPGGNAAAVAELGLTLMLVILRRVKEISTRIALGERIPSIMALSPGLQGKTVGLVGMGDIAYELCKLLLPFRCRILVFSPTSSPTRWTTSDTRYPEAIPHQRVGSLEELLPQVDVLSIHCPLTPSTRNLISTREMESMKPSAVIINTARGGIIDELALAEALKAGKLAGAGLDVMATEPAYGENLGELGKMLNVVILPHLGGSTDEITLQGCVKAVDIMADYLDGKGAVNRVV